jgi:hypothetical protein
MGKEFILGKMEGAMLVNIKRIRNMALALILGLMERSTWECGKIARGMEKDSIFLRMEVKGQEYGSRIDG